MKPYGSLCYDHRNKFPQPTHQLLCLTFIGSNKTGDFLLLHVMVLTQSSQGIQLISDDLFNTLT